MKRCRIRPPRVLILALLLAGGPAEGLRAEDERGRSLGEPQELTGELTSPYRNQRRRAQEKLRDELREGRGSLPELLSHSEREVRRAAAAVAVRSPELVMRSDLEIAFRVEVDPVTLQTLIDALAVHGGDLPPEGPPEQTPMKALRAQLWRALVHHELESLIHDGTIPGFYDGQFQALWRITPEGTPEQLIEIAQDRSYHYVVRVLAAMALHETRRESLTQDLAPLLMSEEQEFRIQRNEWMSPWLSGPAMTALRREADLSRYVRFSLAKAGRNQPILRMIERIDQQLRLYESEMQSRGGDDQQREHWREWLRGLLFETGYYFQQFDDFDRATQRYQKLVDQYPESRSCQSAYYNLACIASIRRDRELALRYLREAVKRGFTDHEWLQEDGDLAPLQGDPVFLEILEQARTGQIRIEGSTWLAVLTPHIPAGKSLFELNLMEQTEVLQRGLEHLTPAEVESLLGAAPTNQRAALTVVIRQLSEPEGRQADSAPQSAEESGLSLEQLQSLLEDSSSGEDG